MTYSVKDIAQFIRTYCLLEKEATHFLSLSAWAGNHKEARLKGGQRVRTALASYLQLPIELRKELEKEKSAHVHDLKELQQLVEEVISSANRLDSTDSKRF